MKKLLFILSFFICFSSHINAECNSVVNLRHQPKGGTHVGNGKAPVRPWVIDLTAHVITMQATPCDYTLSLYDDGCDVAYTVFVPAGTTWVTLPATLSGDFELRFEADGYCHFGLIRL